MLTTDINELTADARALLERLGLPDSLPNGFGLLRFAETHLSLLLIGEHFTWKLKKAIRLEFVDHGCIHRRWDSAVTEIELNRRLAPELYIGLLPFRAADNRPGEVIPHPSRRLPEDLVEAAVVMKTIPQENLLSEIISHGRVDTALHIRPLAALLRQFHFGLPPLSENEVTSLIQSFLHAWKANFEALLAVDALNGTAIQELQVHMSSEWPAVRKELERRARDGLFVDGHGDLRTEHVAYLGHVPAVIDCLEFSRPLRANDILADIAFLKMDLELCGRSDLWSDFAGEYRSGWNGWNDSILRYFAMYRALVRCKVEVLSALQRPDPEQHLGPAARYINLASRYRYGIEGPLLIAVAGLMGTGKSSLAASLSRRLAAPHLESDRIRQELFPEREALNTRFGAGKYSLAARQQVYDRMLLEATRNLERHEIVVVDSSFASREIRGRFRDAAFRAGARIVWIHCQLEEPELKRRLQQRLNQRSFSEGRVELLEEQRRTFEAFTAEELQCCLPADTTAAPEDLSHQLLTGLSKNERLRGTLK